MAEEIEVTPEMIEAGCEFYPCRDDADEQNAYFLTRIYRAMAAAAKGRAVEILPGEAEK